MIENLEARLAQMTGAWQDAPADTGSIYAPPPDGEYQALINEFDFIEQNDPPHAAFLKVVFQVDNDPEYSGRLVDTLFALEDPERVKWLKSFFARLGVNVEQTPITEIRPGSALLNGLLDTPVLIKVKRSEKSFDRDGSPRVNIYLQQKLGAYRLAGAPASDVTTQEQLGAFEPAVGKNATFDGDDIPF